MARKSFNIQDFFRGAWTSITRPGEYFSGIDKEGGIGESIIIAVIFGTLAGIISFARGSAVIGISGGIIGSILGTGLGLFMFFGTLLGAMIALYAGGVIILLISAICGGSTAFETNVRVSASLLIILPLKALSGLIAGYYPNANTILSLATSFLGIWMLYHALVHTLECRKRISGIVSVALSFLPVLILMSGLICSKAVREMTKDFKLDIKPEMEKFMKDFPKMDKDSIDSIESLKKMLEEARKNPKIK